MPQYRFRGTNATLLCKYELEPNEDLFSLKWYKEDTEFYRHTPPDPSSQAPPMSPHGQQPYYNERGLQVHHPEPNLNGLVQTWPVPGIKIDVSFNNPKAIESCKNGIVNLISTHQDLEVQFSSYD